MEQISHAVNLSVPSLAQQRGDRDMSDDDPDLAVAVGFSKLISTDSRLGEATDIR
jgi:hypothetical protein